MHTQNKELFKVSKKTFLIFLIFIFVFDSPSMSRFKRICAAIASSPKRRLDDIKHQSTTTKKTNIRIEHENINCIHIEVIKIKIKIIIIIIIRIARFYDGPKYEKTGRQRQISEAQKKVTMSGSRTHPQS